MKLSTGIISMFLLVSMSSPTYCQTGLSEGEKPPIKLLLEVVQPVIHQGEIPTFRLTIKNISSKVVRTLKLKDRPDLQHSYSKVTLTAVGKTIEFRQFISDPGPISEKDFLQLSPGETHTVILDPLPIAAGDLRAGRYAAHAVYVIDPLRKSGARFQSPKIEFVIVE